MAQMPNPSKQPLVGRDGAMAEPWIRYFSALNTELAALANSPAATPVPGPTGPQGPAGPTGATGPIGPAGADAVSSVPPEVTAAISDLTNRVEALEQAPDVDPLAAFVRIVE